jgi:hypothetical protein
MVRGVIQMVTVQRWSGREARALREAKRMSVRAFADHLGVGERMVSKWEAGGDSIIPRPVNQAALDTSLASADTEVRSRFANAMTVPEFGAATPDGKGDALVTKVPNLVLRRIREMERQETRGEFAEAMMQAAAKLGESVSPSERYVARLEDGDVRYPYPAYRRVLTELCGRSMAELGFTSPLAAKYGPPTGAVISNSLVTIGKPEDAGRREPLTIPDPIRSSFAGDMLEAVKRREFLSGMATTVGFGAVGGMEGYAKLSLKKYRPIAARNEDRKVFNGLL